MVADLDVTLSTLLESNIYYCYNKSRNHVLKKNEMNIQNVLF